MMLFGIIMLFGGIESISIFQGVLILVSGFFLGRSVGYFLKIDIRGTISLRISAVLMTVFVATFFTGQIEDDGWSGVLMAAVFASFALLIYIALEAYVRDQIQSAS